MKAEAGSRRSPCSTTLSLLSLLAVGWGCKLDGVDRPVDEDVAIQDDEASSSVPPRRVRLAPLSDFEAQRRVATDFAALPPGSRATGPNPHAIVHLGGDDFVGTLRGSDAVVLLDASGRERDRQPAPAAPVAVVTTGHDEVFVAGLESSTLLRYRVDGDILVRAGAIEVDDATGTRALSTGPAGTLYAADEHRGGLTWIRPDAKKGPRQARFDTCRGPVAMAQGAGVLAVACLLDRSLRLYTLAADGTPQVPVRAVIRHDGPLWSVAPPRAHGDTVLVAAGGVEDRALDRSEGFGWVDSFVFLYALPAEGAPRRLAAANVSEHGVVTPKWLDLEVDGDRIVVDVTGYGGDHRATLRWNAGDTSAPPRVDARPFPPGSTAVAGPLAADPLLDGWVVDAGEEPRVVPVPGASLDPEVRLGEALVFTTLMAPWNVAEGMRSRFTCETCHFEGYADGRIHYTGRGDVHAVTKPLLGLFNNRPHFSRALDRTMTIMVDNEFRAANKGNGHDPWFALAPGEVPLAAWLGQGDRTLSPIDLRRALMSFLMVFTHAPNPATLGRDRFTDLERRGAEVFRDRCESCHQARRITDDPSTREPFEAWEAAVFAPSGPVVWAKDGYEKTGITPYVHAEGARTPSLRRLYKKHPYFTSGSADDIDAVLERAAYAGDRFWHGDGEDVPPDAKRLTDDERRALAAFLDLL